ncbi:MAG: alkaline phosphatase, partial [Planctomycetota bacterium]
MNRLKSILFQWLLFVVFVSAPLLAESSATETLRPKYVFLMIGDGMGFSHLQLTEIYRNNVLARQSELAPALVIPTLPATGIASTYSADSSITDSAAAGTALATGHKTNDGVIARSPDLKTDYESLAVAAKRKGMKSGILSSVSLDHATPAVFYAHQNSRKMYYEIATELAISDIDFFGGGGLLGDARRGKKPSPLETAAQSGFTVCVDPPAFDRLLNAAAPINTHKRLLLVNPVLESEQAFEYEIDLRRTIDPARAKDHISLAAFTRMAISALDTPDGFFIMVEGGKIDWANHSNDALTSIYEVLEFDAAVAAAVAFYQTRPAETLVVVTSDHETGGLTLSPSKTYEDSSIALLDKQRGSRPAIAIRWRAAKASSTAPALDNALRFVYDNFGLWTEDMSPA